MTTRMTVRTGALLLLTGIVAEYAVTTLHPSREAPNDHQAVFAEYAASDNWIAVHLAQFVTGVVVLAGIVILLQGLRTAGAPALLTRAGEVCAAITGAVFAVLQGVDGVALKHAVDSLAIAPPQLQAAAFHDAETVRWTEWAMAGYFRITFGLTVIAVGFAVLRSSPLPKWAGPVAMVAGIAFIVDGIGVSYDGFAGSTPANLTSWLSLVAFALAATAAAWRLRPSE